MIREALVTAGILKPDVLIGQTDTVATIVRELSERGPFLEPVTEDCDTCRAQAFGPDIKDPANHEPSCLWRRAREMYPKEPE